MGLIFSIYILADKEHILSQINKLTFAYLPVKIAKRVKEIAKITSDIFTKFISGQATEAVILGVLCFIGMSVFKFEYPLLCSTIIAVTSFIPIIGSIIGCIPAVFILLMIHPIKALWFIVFIIILQQIEGDFIYPKVVGDSIGLPPLWVFFAIIAGGGLGGVLGMILGVPTASVLYKLLSSDANKKIKLKQYQKE
jgi:predicted PurR-regulated permease PerM